MRSRTRERPKNPLDHIPEAVRYAREQAGLTQSQLADLCGTTQGQISEIERGTRNAPPAMIRKLAAALNCPRVILERKREPETAPPAARPVPEPGMQGDERTDEPALPELRGTPVGGS